MGVFRRPEAAGAMGPPKRLFCEAGLALDGVELHAAETGAGEERILLETPRLTPVTPRCRQRTDGLGHTRRGGISDRSSGLQQVNRPSAVHGPLVLLHFPLQIG